MPSSSISPSRPPAGLSWRSPTKIVRALGRTLSKGRKGPANRVKQHRRESKPLPPVPIDSAAQFADRTPTHGGRLSQMLYALILSFLHPSRDHRTLFSLLTVSRFFHKHVMPCLYTRAGESLDGRQYALLLVAIAPVGSTMASLITRLTVADTFSDFMSHTLLQLLGRALRRMPNLTALTFNSGSYTHPSAFVLGGVAFRLAYFEWSSCVADERSLARFLKGQYSIQTLSISWTSIPVDDAALPNLTTLIGDTGAVLAFLPTRGIKQLQWIEATAGDWDDFRFAASMLTHVTTLVVSTVWLDVMVPIVDSLKSVGILELCVANADVAALADHIRRIPHLQTVVLSATHDAVFPPEFTNLDGAASHFLASCKHLEEVFIQKRNSRGHDAPRRYDRWTRDTDGPELALEGEMFSWKIGYEPYF